MIALLAAFLGLFSERAIHRAASVLGAVWWHVLRYRRRVIAENLARAFPERSARERAALGREACTHLVLALFDVLRLPRHLRRGFEGVVRFEGVEHFHAAKAKGKGVLCLSGHLGSFELAAAAAARAFAKPVSLVVKSFPRPVDRYLTRVRTDAGFGLIRADSAVRGILRALAEEQMVVFVLDQNATRKIGVFVPFFGVEACTMSALAALALRTGAPVVAATMYRDERGAHVLRMHPAFEVEAAATREETIRRMTAVYTRFLEDAIREHPAQWFWTHKRWRTRPASD